MTRSEATQQILDASREIARQMMRIQPAIVHLQAPETQSECIRAAHALTRELEIIKKQLLRLQDRDDSAPT